MTKGKTSPKKSQTDNASPTEWTEILILIHGISPESDPKPPDKAYDKLLEMVNKALPEGNKFDDECIIKVNWGIGRDSVADAPFDDLYVDEYLAEVERRVGRKIVPIILDQEAHDPLSLLSPGRLLRRLSRRFKVREMLLQVIPDLFYYVSADGERVIRNRIFKSIGENIVRRHRQEMDKGISLTIIGHSAGSIIAHDFLYHLFGKSNRQMDEDIKNDQAVAEVVKLREVQQAGRLRLRRLYTFGSPITAMLFRSNSLVKRVMEDIPIDPEDIGLREADNIAPATPRWVNFWDVDDFASFPVAPFYKNENGIIEDKCIDRDRVWTRDLLPSAHLWYWQSQEVADYIARTF